MCTIKYVLNNIESNALQKRTVFTGAESVRHSKYFKAFWICKQLNSSNWNQTSIIRVQLLYFMA